MSISHVEEILRPFASQSLDIQGIALVSSQGQPITPSIGLDENVTLIMAGTMLQVGNQIAKECEWENMEQVSLQAQEGYLTLFPCGQDIFLLLKTANLPDRSLEQKVRQIIGRLRGKLDETESVIVNEFTYDLQTKQTLAQTANFPDHSTTIPLKPTPEFILYCQQQLAQFIGPIAPVVCRRILKAHPYFSINQLVEALAKTIPNSEQVVEFYQLISAWKLTNKKK